MKRILLAATLLMVLWGCTPATPEQTVPQTTAAPTTETTAPYMDPGLYLPGTALEAQTAGAVRAYLLTGENTMDILAMGDRLLAFSSCDTGMQVTVLTGDNCALYLRKELPGCMGTNPGTLRISDRKLAYYDGNSRSVVILNEELQETGRVLLPDTLTANPVISSDLTTVFYCAGDKVHAMDLTTGISRLVRQYSCQWQSPVNSFFDDSVLQLHIITSDMELTTGFLSTENGQLLGEDPGLLSLTAGQSRLFLTREEGSLPEYLFGTAEGNVQAIYPLEPGLYPSATLEKLLGVREGEEGLSASVYDLSTGLRAAALEAPGLLGMYDALMDNRGYVWFLAYDAENQQDMLYRWDPALSPSEDQTVYTGPRYTREDPDTAGLAACRARADALEEVYGVRIYLGEGMPLPWDYTLTTEFRTDAIGQGLDSLEKALAAYPEGFLTEMVAGTPSKTIHISLVRDISQQVDGLQYWSELDACIALRLGTWTEQNFHHELSHVLDHFIIANCMHYDDWEELNPQGSVYDYSYELYKSRSDRSWLEGENRAFIDSYSMTYPREDRARILEYAMMPGNEELFQYPYLQNKLLQICKAIRESYGWKRSEAVFPWEQYLTTPLAYKKRLPSAS